MQVQSINNHAPSFRKLKITPEARALIEREKGGVSRLHKYKKELANSRWDLIIEKAPWGDDIWPYFGKNRNCCVIPCYLQDEFVMVYSAEVCGDNEDDIVDCLKFSSAERAKEVYETLKKHFHTKNKTPLQHLDWDVCAMKAFTEAELVPQTESPWAWAQKRAAESQPKKQEVSVQPLTEEKKKPPFSQRLNEAWKVLLGK